MKEEEELWPCFLVCDVSLTSESLGVGEDHLIHKNMLELVFDWCGKWLMCKYGDGNTFAKKSDDVEETCST